MADDPIYYLSGPAVKATVDCITKVRTLSSGDYNGIGTPVVNHIYGQRWRWGMVTKGMPAASLGSTDGGGAYYNIRTATGNPTVVDPTLDLQIPTDADADATPPTGEQFSATDDALGENTIEANLSPGDEPSHWVPWGTIVPMLQVGTSNETPPRPVFRFAFPKPGHQSYKIIGAYGSIGDAGGSGRYKANPVFSRPTAVQLVNDSFDDEDDNGGVNLPDHGETFAPPGSDEDESIVNPAVVCVENIAEDGESGYSGHNIHLLPVDGTMYVIGYFTGGYSDGTDNGGIPTPIVRCYAPPQQVTIAVTVEDDDSGTNAAPDGPWPYATFKYNVFTLGGVQILASQAPACARPPGVLTGAAGHGTVCIYPNGTLTLWWVDEQQDIESPCTVGS